jgi:hypothetical protein
LGRVRERGRSNMKYIKPILKVEEAEVVNMLAESLVIDGKTTVDGGDALSKEDKSWEIWSDDKE